MIEPRYADVEVDLSDVVRHPANIVTAVREALREADVDSYEIAEFSRQAYAGSFDELLRTSMLWVTVTFDGEAVWAD